MPRKTMSGGKTGACSGSLHTTAPALNTTSKAPKTPHYCWYCVPWREPLGEIPPPEKKRQRAGKTKTMEKEKMNYQNDLWAKIYDQYNSGRHESELAFYKKECENTKGKCLEIATGTGMILLNLLKEGLDVYGFDLSEQMLKQLLGKANKLGLNENQIERHVSCQNMVSFAYDFKFDLIFIPARSFLHLTNQEDQIKCLQQIKKHLNPNGRLIMNFFQPNLKFILLKAEQTDNWEHHSAYSFADGTPNIDLYFKQINDIPNQIQNIDWKFVSNGEEHFSRMFVRWIYKEEFQLLLKHAGFKKWNLFGGFDRSEYSQYSNEMIWEAYK